MDNKTACKCDMMHAHLQFHCVLSFPTSSKISYTLEVYKTYLSICDRACAIGAIVLCKIYSRFAHTPMHSLFSIISRVRFLTDNTDGG